ACPAPLCGPPPPHPCCASLAPTLSSGSHARQLLPLTVRRPPGFRGRLPPRALRTLGRRRSGLHPSLRCPSSARPDSSAAWLARIRPLYWPLPPFGPSAARRRLLCPRLTSALAVRPPCDDLSLVAETQRRPPEVRSTAFAARPPDLPPRSLMTLDFAIICPLVRPGRPLYPVLVHRAAALLYASFGPRLATTPLRFANPSPPSGWIEDSHLQAVDHARHTKRRRALASAARCALGGISQTLGRQPVTSLRKPLITAFSSAACRATSSEAVPVPPAAALVRLAASDTIERSRSTSCVPVDVSCMLRLIATVVVSCSVMAADIPAVTLLISVNMRVTCSIASTVP